MRGERSVLRNEAGASTVEFALVIPIVLLVILAALDFTRALLAYTTINHGSREGVRYAVLHPGANVREIEDEVKRRTQPLSADAVDVTVTLVYSDGRSPDPWSRADATTTPETVTVRVDVSYPWQATSALIAGFFTATGQSSALVSTSFMDMRR